MDDELYFTWKSHMNDDIYSTIYGKEIYPVAISPLIVHKSCIHEVNIRRREYSNISQMGKYDFKDITFNRNLFVDWNCEK